MRQDDLARALGTTQSSVSGWINGKYEPAAATVFAIERALELEAGHLSRPLGYLPAEPGNSPLSVEGAIAQSPGLDEHAKTALIAMYHVLVNRHTRNPVGDGERLATKASSSRQARLASAAAPANRPRSVATGR